MNISKLFHRTVIGLACFSSLGVLVHDTKFDKAVSLALPAVTVSAGIGARSFDGLDNAHTHVERVSWVKSVSAMPRIQPRDDQRRFYLQKNLSRTNSLFGGSRIFWPSV